MPDRDARTDADIQRAITAEREAIDEAIAGLRRELTTQTDLRRQLPALALGAFVAGFALSGGIGATVRPLMRKHYARRTKRGRGILAYWPSR